MRNYSPNMVGKSFSKLAQVYDHVKNSQHHVESEEPERRPIKARLGYKQPYRGQFDYKFRNRNQTENRHPRDWRRDDGRQPSRYADLICDFCGIKGHIKRKCFKLKHLQKGAVNLLQTSEPEPSVDRHLSELLDRMNARDSDSDSELDEGNYACNLVTFINKISNPCLVDVIVEQKNIKMEVDCGSSVTVMNKSQYFSNFEKKLKKSSKQLIVVNGAKLLIEGETSVLVNYRGVESKCKLLVLNCSNDFTPLLGRDWLDIFYPNWRNYFITQSMVNNVSEGRCTEYVNEIKQRFSNVFTKDFSSPIVGYEADLVLKNDVPIFKKAYTVPYRLKNRVCDYLMKLQKEKVITPVKTSEWASPVIVVMKKNDDIRLVIDCKVSVNKYIIPNTYPLPVAQDLFASVAGSKVFCALDLEGAYTQLSLSERSKQFMVINTIKGLFTYNRLPQGASSSASIFQQVMEQVLEGIENVCVYLDDVLIAGKDLEDCKCKLVIVLERLEKANIKVNLEKRKFFVENLDYLGHVISNNGLLPCKDKLDTIKNAKNPVNVTELKSFLGLINYYNKFIPHLSSKLYHLYNLLRNGVKFVWDENCLKAFEKCKSSLINADFLEFYDPNKPIVIVSDASSYGLGGVIAHIVDGVEKPIGFTSFSLNDAQKSYPILHLEALALVCTVKKFHKYLYGQKFQIFTDHKPLVGIFGKSGRNSIYVTRLQRFILELSIYDYDIQYRCSAKMGNADFCSRFPLDQNITAEYDHDLDLGA